MCWWKRLWVVLAFVGGCDNQLGGDVDASFDASLDAGIDSGFVVSEGRPEICGNEVDDDLDGVVDDGCECSLGLARACWLGPFESRTIGACRDGEQVCESHAGVGRWGRCRDAVMPQTEIAATGMDEDCDGVVDEPDAVCVPVDQHEAACENGRDDDCDTLVDCDDPDCAEHTACDRGCDDTETVCWGGYDDDCDGSLDCDDVDCASSPSCGGALCDEGTPIFTSRAYPPRTSTHSGIAPGDGRAVQPMHCGESECSPGQVEVRPVDAPEICVPPPPPCPEGEDPEFVRGAWRCMPPCDYLIQYGFLYGYQQHCADRPDPECPSGQVPTFNAEMQRWVCDETCDNGQYDRVWLDGELVCVPC